MVASPVKAAVQDIKRLREITRVLTKHGFHALVRRIGLGGEEADRKLLGAEALAALDGPMLGEDRLEAAVRLRRVLEDLGPTFVKLGQVLSTRPDIIPAEFIAEFRHLQARVEPMPLEDVVSQIERALGATVDDVFETFEAHPLGSASIGQVHAATLPGGQRCVVKVQRPNIGEKIRSDLDILYSLAKLLEATIEEVELYSPTGIVKEFSGALFKELDFEQEAKSMREFARNFADSEGIEAPAVHEELTTDTILTMEFVDAKPLSEIEGGTPRASMLLDRLLDATVEMVLYDGFYHADPHPGNIFVRDDDTLVYIDFGMVGRLSVGQQDEVINLIIAVLTGDVDGISRTLLRMGRPIGRVSLREFKADIVRIRDKYLLANLSEINVTQFIQEVMDAAQYHRIQLNTAYAVLVKTAMTIEGIMRELEPELDLPARATPYVRQLAARRFTARKLGTSALRTSMAFSNLVTQLPDQLDQILMDLEGGNLTVTVRNESLDAFGQHLNTLGTRLFLGIMSAGLAVCSALLVRDTALVIEGVAVLPLLGIFCGASATILFWWALSWHIFGGKESSKLRLGPLFRFLRRER